MANRDEIYVELDEILSKLTAKPDIERLEKSEYTALWIMSFFVILLLFLSLLIDGESLVQMYFHDAFGSMSNELFGAMLVYLFLQRAVIELRTFRQIGRKLLPYLIGIFFMLAIIFYVIHYAYIAEYIFPDEKDFGGLFLDLGTTMLGALVLFFSLERILKAIEASNEDNARLRDRFHELRQKLQTASDKST
jgi:hypothetical protein